MPEEEKKPPPPAKEKEKKKPEQKGATLGDLLAAKGQTLRIKPCSDK